MKMKASFHLDRSRPEPRRHAMSLHPKVSTAAHYSPPYFGLRDYSASLGSKISICGTIWRRRPLILSQSPAFYSGCQTKPIADCTAPAAMPPVSVCSRCSLARPRFLSSSPQKKTAAEEGSVNGPLLKHLPVRRPRPPPICLFVCTFLSQEIHSVE